MKIKALPDRITSTGFFFLAVLVIIESRKLSLGDIHNPGPGFVPFFLGLSMALLSALNFCVPDLRMNEDAFWNSWRQGKNILLIFVGLGIYLVLFEILGFLVNTFWLIIYLMKLAGAGGYMKCVLVGFFAIVVIYILFYQFLIIPFPRGLAGV